MVLQGSVQWGAGWEEASPSPKKVQLPTIIQKNINVLLCSCKLIDKLSLVFRKTENFWEKFMFQEP